MLQVNPQFYAFRWITLLLTQEFSFAESLLIWDTLLSDPDGPQVSQYTNLNSFLSDDRLILHVFTYYYARLYRMPLEKTEKKRWRKS